MTIDQIREKHRARPFQPFDLQLADGRSIHVQRPEWMMVLPSGNTVVVVDAEGDRERVDVKLVTDLKDRINGGY